jgi:hypothetical protein
MGSGNSDVQSAALRKNGVLPLIFVAAFLCALSYAQAPSMGDDIDYFGFALGRYHNEPLGAAERGFHFLRWPVWGVIWLAQLVTGPGYLSYFLAPALYFALGAVLVFWISREIAGVVAGWFAMFFFLFHPLLDGPMSRPMPDISEGVLGTLGFVLLWTQLRTAEFSQQSRFRAAVVGALLGILIFVTWANRPTGLIWVIALLMISLTRPRLMLPVFAVAAVVCTTLFIAECSVYQRLLGEFWHSWQANQRATGRVGTEPVAIYKLPFRFVDTLFDKRASLVVLVPALYGAWVCTKSRRLPELWVVAWFALIFLGISCALQSLSPPRPLVRDATRFLGSVAFPMSVLAGVGLQKITGSLPRSGRAPVAMVVLALMPILGERPLRDLRALDEINRWIAKISEQAEVISHDAFRSLAFMAAPKQSARLRWHLIDRGELMDKSGVLSGARFPQADHLFLARERFFVTAHKLARSGKLAEPDALRANLLTLLNDWEIVDVSLRRETPDYMHFVRAQHACEAVSLLPALSQIHWQPQDRSERHHGWSLTNNASELHFKRLKEGALTFHSGKNPVPDGAAGKAFALFTSVNSGTSQPFTAILEFSDDEGRLLSRQILRPHAARGFSDFLACAVPVNAKDFVLRLKISSKCDEFRVHEIATCLRN